MRFELDNVLIDQILFSMENQDGEFLLDTREGIVIDANTETHDIDEEKKGNDTDRYVSLPEWTPGDGYRLMEKFSANVKNPVIRHELAQALNKNKGVFRSFRNVLEQYPETEKLWFNYKDSEMKKVVTLWYNALREEWGLAPVGIEPEDDTLSLVLEDFYIKETEESGINSCLAFIAENAKGEIAGTITGKIDNSILFIDAIDVKTDFQGLGIGKTLLSKMIEEADKKGFDVKINLPLKYEYFSRTLFLENFRPISQEFIRKARQ